MKSLLKSFKSVGFRRGLVFSFDLLAIGVAFVFAFALRFDFNIPADQMMNLRRALPWIYVIQSSVFVAQGLYRGLWYFASLPDLVLIIRSAALGCVLSASALFFFYDRLFGWPRSIFLLDAIFLICILGGGRFLYRFLRELSGRQRKRRDKRIIVIGAGRTGNLISREIEEKIIGFLDDNPNLRGSGMRGARVLGNVDMLKHFIEKLNPTEVIVAIPSLTGPKLKKIVKIAQEKGIPLRLCPPIHDVVLGRVKISQLREVQVEDLLRREVVKVDDMGLEAFFSGKKVLVTGAGGSIGSELCRQVLMFKPSQLILFERSEYNLYQFQQEFSPLPPELTFVIGDILDERRLAAVFEQYQPDYVLHAAAYKHVPMMEENIYESVRNNVLGTYQLLTACARFKVKKFLMISTDKAVRPTSVMGATKRMAELVTYAMAQKHRLLTAAVRFGNVLDSQGSVLPLFRKQISQGGPVTVTHPDITRYFMTIPEASQLVLQASIMGQGGEVFLLDMGQPVLIRELAEELIRLSGYKPYEEIDVQFSGLRKGEKLYEELLFDISHATRTSHSKILVSTVEHSDFLPKEWEEDLLTFSQREEIPSNEQLLEWIQRWVPEFTLSPNLHDIDTGEMMRLGSKADEAEEDKSSRPVLH